MQPVLSVRNIDERQKRAVVKHPVAARKDKYAPVSLNENISHRIAELLSRVRRCLK